MLIHPILEGKNVIDMKSADGLPIFRRMIEKKDGRLDYEWKDPDGKVRAKTALFKYDPEHDWILSIGAYQEEIYGLLHWIRNSLLVALFFGTIFMVTIIIIFSGKLTDHISKTVVFADQLAAGDFSQTFSLQKTDEMGQLAEALNRISQIINDVNEIITGVAASMEDQSVTTQEIHGNITEISEGIRQVDTNLSQSSQLSQNVHHDMEEADQVNKKVSEFSSQVNVSAGDLSQVAGQLKEMVNKFKIS